MKYTITIAGFDLALPGNKARVYLPGNVVSVRVSAIKGYGTWASETLSVKKGAGGVSLDFATARTIPAGGTAAVFLTSTDLESATEIEVKKTGTASENGFTDLLIEVEQDSGPPPWATGPLGRVDGVAL